MNYICDKCGVNKASFELLFAHRAGCKVRGQDENTHEEWEEENQVDLFEVLEGEAV